MRSFDPFGLSRELAATHERVAAGALELRLGTAQLDPFRGKEWPGLTTYEQVRALDPTDPLREPLRRWLFHLIDQRIQTPWLLEEGRLLHQVRHPLDSPRRGQFSLVEMAKHGAEAEGEERVAWWDGFMAHERELGELRAGLWQRRVEVARRLGEDPEQRLLSPVDQPEQLVDAARRYLEATREVARAHGAGSWLGLLELAEARGASEGLPARLAPDSVLELLGGRHWVRGLKLRLTLPERRVPASFARALELFGEGWHEALARADLPFVVAREPRRAGALRTGVLLASRWTSPVFWRRRLGLGKAQAQASALAFSLAWLAEGRRRALAVLVRASALDSGEALGQAAVELSTRELGEEWGSRSMLARLEVPVGADCEFAALVSGFEAAREAGERMDEDYFDDPRFFERLRDEAAQPPTAPLDGAGLLEGAGRVAAAFQRDV
ncbi:MAG TPA: hypothetical protein VLC09_08115 [Polyangiaceae bacterium]|nr:hypothetical protein [Polyangiaceae bacterium]